LFVLLWWTGNKEAKTTFNLFCPILFVLCSPVYCLIQRERERQTDKQTDFYSEGKRESDSEKDCVGVNDERRKQDRQTERERDRERKEKI